MQKAEGRGGSLTAKAELWHVTRAGRQAVVFSTRNVSTITKE